jgi:hypothetical protein
MLFFGGIIAELPRENSARDRNRFYLDLTSSRFLGGE